MSDLYQLPRPVIFAHRGASAHAPENTLSAFELAVEHRADAIELDAKLTADGHVVVIHDRTVDRTTGSHGNVDEMELDEIRKLDAGQTFSPEFRGERIPTLDEVFESVEKRIFINVELTDYHSLFSPLPERVAEMIERHGMRERVLISSFFPWTLTRIRKVLRHVPVAILPTRGVTGWAARSAIGRCFAPKIIHPHYTDVNDRFMRKEKSGGRSVHAWVVNEPSDVRNMVALEVDGIITDDPSGVRRLLEKQC